jgi:hypothetical protein
VRVLGQSRPSDAEGGADRNAAHRGVLATQLVLDPFAGSWSTLVAAALSGRRYLGIELEQKYCRVDRERLASVQSSFLGLSRADRIYASMRLSLRTRKL